MRNELFVADNCLADLGSRNIGDQYFCVRAAVSSISTWSPAGPIVRSSRSFDRILEQQNMPCPIACSRRGGRRRRARPWCGPRVLGLRSLWAMTSASRNAASVVPAAVLVDKPPRWRGDLEPDQEVTIANNLRRSPHGRSGADRDLAAIPSRGVDLMRELVVKGVHVRILTNSLASTDSPLVDTGYAQACAAARRAPSSARSGCASTVSRLAPTARRRS